MANTCRSNPQNECEVTGERLRKLNLPTLCFNTKIANELNNSTNKRKSAEDIQTEIREDFKAKLLKPKSIHMEWIT